MHNILASLESKTPFHPLNVGEFIDPRLYDVRERRDLLLKLLKVKAVVHAIAQQEGGLVTMHHIKIYTEAVANGREAIFPQIA